jgi:2-dehydro-3-deoxyglucarate aldolase/4-hydroxy-2-oxoheptanedioate aldolase
MRENSVKRALKEGKLQLGCGFGNFRSAEIPKILAAAGLQWAFVDTEHGNFDLETVNDICRVARLVNLCPIVRVADFQYSLVARALDSGAGGIIFPRTEDPMQLEKAISWTYYPPKGIRGFGLAPNNADYEALSFTQLIDYYDENLMRVVQIESVRAVEAIDEILSVPGFDTVMIGPADLSISLGVPGNMDHPKMIGTIEAIRDACIRHGIVPGIHTRASSMARFWKERGMLFLGCSNDLAMLLERSSENVKAILKD